MRPLLFNVTLAFFVAACAPAIAEETPKPEDHALSLSAGGSTWSGDYGAPTDTTISALLVGARYSLGGVRLTASMPWMSIRSTGGVFAGINSTPLIVSPSAAMPRKVRSGWADLTLGASYLLDQQNPMGVDFEISGKVKLPTASRSSGISTGKTDYAVALEASRAFGSVVPFASVGYRHFGDNRTWNLSDGFGTSVGASYVAQSGIVGMISYDYSEAASRFIGDSHELVASVSMPFKNERFRLTGFGSVGLSQGASDLSGGLSLSLNL